MGRPPTITDADILRIARRCIIEHGPGVSLSTIAAQVGLSPGGMVKRFGTKERLVFCALLPNHPPAWLAILRERPPDPVESALAHLLIQLSLEFTEVGPAFAALRMSGHDPSVVLGNGPGPFAAVRKMLARWLRDAGIEGDVDAIADAGAGAAEARGFTRWIGPELVHPPDDQVWADTLAALMTRSHRV